MFNMQQVQLEDIVDVQDILNKAAHDTKTPKVILIGAAYLYTFHLDDFEQVRKFNILGRYDIRAVKQWHVCLERWCNDQTVTLGGKTFKPIAIDNNFKRVTNEGMEMIANTFVGGSGAYFKYRSIGDGDIDEVSPSDTTLVHEVDRIDVTADSEGGSISRDGTTIYSIGNHLKTVPTPANGVFTECGMHNTDLPSTDKMLDHSAFEEPIPHTQNADAPGSTTVIFMCSA